MTRYHPIVHLLRRYLSRPPTQRELRAHGVPTRVSTSRLLRSAGLPPRPKGTKVKPHKWTPVRNIFKASKEEIRAEKAWVPTVKPKEVFPVDVPRPSTKRYDDLPPDAGWMA